MSADGEFVFVLQCYVLRLSYDFQARCAEIWMPEGSCTDMAGAIKFATTIDPKAQAIITWAGGKLDTTYVRKGNNWEAQSSR